MTEAQSHDHHQAPAPARRPKEPMGLKLVKFAFLVLVILAIVSVIALVVHHYQKPNTVTTLPSATVHITAQGFQPATLAIKQGTVVIWHSDDGSKTHVIASNPYPSNNTLPGLKSSQLGNGAEYRYTFNHTGTYNYHDNLDPTINGTVIVD